MSALPSPAKAGAVPSAATLIPVHVLGSALGAYPGAEVVGVVGDLAATPDAPAASSTALATGQIVVVPRLLPCGECEPCRRGRVSICAGRARRPQRPQAFEQVPARFVLPLGPPFLGTPPTVESAAPFAALCDALLAPYSGLVRAGLGPGTLCVVVGRGFRAALSAVVARAMGATVAMVAQGTPEPEAERLLAAPYSLLAVLRDESLDPAALRQELASLATGAGLPAHGLCFVETSGSDAGRALTLSLLSAGGTAVLLDRAEPCADATHAADAGDRERATLAMDLPTGPGQQSPALLAALVEQGCQIIGGGSVHPDLLVELMALCERAQIDLAGLTRTVGPEAIDAVMTARRCGTGDTLTLPVVAYPPPPAPPAPPPQPTSPIGEAA